MLVALEGARGSVGGRRSCQATLVIRRRQKSHVSVMTCGLAVCDLKLVGFPLLGCHATFGSSVRLLDVASSSDAVVFCSREFCVNNTVRLFDRCLE